MRRSLLAMLLVFLFACGGLLGTPLERSERWYERHTKSITLQVMQAKSPDLRQQIIDAQARHVEVYGAAPSEEQAREDVVRELVKVMEADMEGFQAALDAEQAEREAIEASEYEKYRRNWDGRWSAKGHVLNIGTNDSVHYENNSGAMNKTIDAGLVSLTQTELVVGALGINTTFTIERPPTMGENKLWTMKLDGVIYTWLGP